MVQVIEIKTKFEIKTEKLLSPTMHHVVVRFYVMKIYLF